MMFSFSSWFNQRKHLRMMCFFYRWSRREDGAPQPIQIEKRSDDVTKLNLWTYGIGWHIQKEQDEKCHWPKNQPVGANCWFSNDVTKIQTTKLSILLRFYFHGVLEQLKTNFQTNFRFKRVLGFVIEYAWISKLLRDAAFTWRPRELSCRLKKWLISGNFAI